jgi:uncharacterized protein (TIGR00106 family)
LIHAEISIYPVGTGSTSASFYIAKSLEVIQELGIKHQLTPMGTILEAKTIDEIYKAAKEMMQVVHNLGVMRVEVVLKIDSRNDKQVNLEEKLESVKKHLKD